MLLFISLGKCVNVLWEIYFIRHYVNVCVCGFLHFVMNKGPSTNAIAMKCAASQRCRCRYINICVYTHAHQQKCACGAYAVVQRTHAHSPAYVLQLFILPALCIGIDAFTNTCIYIQTHTHTETCTHTGTCRRSFISLCTHNGFTCLLTA